MGLKILHHDFVKIIAILLRKYCIIAAALIQLHLLIQEMASTWYQANNYLFKLIFSLCFYLLAACLAQAHLGRGLCPAESSLAD